MKIQHTSQGFELAARFFLVAFAFFTGLFPCLVPISQAQAAETDHKILIVCFSRSGNTRALAEQIQTATGGKLVELEPVEPYPADYRLTVSRARRELASDAHPPLKTKIDDIDAYNLILLGSPNWGGSIAPPVKTFLSEHDLSGKTIAPFMTHGGSGLGRAASDIRRFAPRANLAEGLAVRGSAVSEAHRNVTTWLGRLGLRHN